MCLVKVREEEDVTVPVRRVAVRTRSVSPHHHHHRRSSVRVSRTSHDRISRTEIVQPPSRPISSSYLPIPAPTGRVVPAPQPIPVFVAEPAPARPPSHHHHGGAHYVEVSPRSSYASHSPSRSDYVVHEHEYRREVRDRTPDRYETFRYVESRPDDHYDHLSARGRSRSRSRDPRGSYHETRERVVIVDDDNRRRTEYRR